MKATPRFFYVLDEVWSWPEGATQPPIDFPMGDLQTPTPVCNMVIDGTARETTNRLALPAPEEKDDVHELLD